MGTVFSKVQLHLTDSFGAGGWVTYYAYELKNVRVTGYTVGGSDKEVVSLSFEEIRVSYTEMDHAGKKKGNVEYSWKVEGAGA